MGLPMTALQRCLLAARKDYSKCAAGLESKIKTCGLTPVLSERVIGVGVAADWVRRAAELEDIRYLGDQLNDSNRKASFTELLRYNFSWFGLNAIFSRDTLLQLVGTAQNSSEFARFCVLFDAASLVDATATIRVLHDLLARKTEPRLPSTRPGTAVPTLRAIQAKYLPGPNAKGTTNKAVTAALFTGDWSGLNLPTLLYAFRNWSVHGNALDGCFGSRPGFLQYVTTLHGVLAEVHASTAARLLAAILASPPTLVTAGQDQGLAAPANLAPLTDDEHVRAQVQAYSLAIARGGGTLPAYDHAEAVGDFWKAAGMVQAARTAQRSAG